MMKKLSFITLALLSLLTISCTKEISPQNCTLNDLVGTWIWVTENGEAVPNAKIEIGTIKADGTEEYWSLKENKWAKTDYPISVSEGIIHLGDVGDCYIVNYDYLNLVIESKADKTRYGATRVVDTELKQLYGTWIGDSYVMSNSQRVTNFQLVLNEDNTFVMNYDGVAEPTTGKYYIFNEFLIYQSNEAGSIRLSFDMDETGIVCNHYVINDDMTHTTNTMRRMRAKDFTLDDVVGIWLTTTKDGKRIPNKEATICTGIDNSGNTVISGVVDGKWVSNNVKLTVKNNVVTRVINGVTDSYTIVYFDRDNIIWRSNQDGSVTTRKNIKQREDLSKLVLGFWRSDDIAQQEGDSDLTNISFRAKGDSSRLTLTNKEGVTKTINSLYKIYGDIMVLYDDTQFYSSLRIDFGYDAQRKEQYMNHMLADENGKVTEFVLYKPDLEPKLAGGWIWDTEDGELVATDSLEISFFNTISKIHDYQIFGDEPEHILEPYYVEGRTIYYPEDEEVPVETILKVDENNLEITGTDDIVYGASRIIMENPLKEQIVGKWACPNFNKEEPANITHYFDKNGLVYFIVNGGDPVYGTYKLYNNLLVMNTNGDLGEINILWIVKDIQPEKGTMTFYKLLADGTTYENVLTKQ